MTARHALLPAASFAGLAGIALLGIAVATAYFGMRSVNETIRLDRLALNLAAGIEGLQASLKDVEALQREFLITGDPGLVARFDAQREKIRLHLSILAVRFEHPEQRAAMPALEAAVSARLAQIGQTLQERGRSGTDRAARLEFEPARLAAAARADALLDEIRGRHRRIVAQREVESGEDLGFLERGMLVGILFAAVLLGWSVRTGAKREVARQAAEAGLQARSRELRLLIDALPASIGYVDPAERVLLHNRVFAEWLGVPSARIVGRTLRELLGADVYAAAEPYIRRALAGEAVQYERSQRDPSGASRVLSVSLVPHRSPGGQVVGYYALLTDVTDLKALSRMKSEFVAMVSHEVRTPVTAIHGALGLLAGGTAGTLPPDANRLVGIANANCARLVRLVDDILDIERIEAGEIAISLQDEDLARLVPLAVVAAGPMAQQRKVRIEVAGDAPAARVRTDGGRVSQVLGNLLANAIQFSPEGGVVRVAVELREGMLRVSVRDHGPGVSEEMRPRLFQTFAQDPSVARGRSGRFGLGLAIAKRLVERLGGGIGYDPAPGGGALFWFELPVAQSVVRDGAGSA